LLLTQCEAFVAIHKRKQVFIGQAAPSRRHPSFRRPPSAATSVRARGAAPPSFRPSLLEKIFIVYNWV
jgi:hypothetical protein